MTMTQLEQLVQQAVDRSVVMTMTRYTDRVTESLVEEILKDPANKAELAALIHAALKQALANLQAPPPVDLHTP